MISPLLFFRSPFARHPWLFLRKIQGRLGRHDPAISITSVPAARLEYPSSWCDALLRGTRAGTEVPKDRSVRSFARVFGREFTEEQLLELCRSGPQPGRSDLTGDIKLIWDFSRAHALWANALLGHASENAQFLRRWIKANANLDQPAWTCAMDVALRAVNWIFADVVARQQISAQLGSEEWVRWVWLHGAVIWHRLETRLHSNNHYLADLLGLAVVGSVFPEDSSARRWRAFAEREFPRALLAQTRSDGALNEASLRYHAFVTEMALWTRLALGRPFCKRAEARLQQMCQIMADFHDASGDVFALGDDDSGRVLDLEWAGAGRVCATLHLAATQLGQKFVPVINAIYPESGWWVQRAGDFVVAFEFGGVGLHGFGAHAHNDDFSFCLDWRGQAVIVDPGTYLYTSDPANRNAFRSVRAHNTICIDGQEPRPVSEKLFHLPGSDAAAPVQENADGSRVFERTVGSALKHRRALLLDRTGLRLQDWIEGEGRHTIQWRFHLHPKVQAGVLPNGFSLHVANAGNLQLYLEDDLRKETPGPRMSLEPAKYSAGYGQIESTQMCCASIETQLPTTLRWRIRTSDS